MAGKVVFVDDGENILKTLQRLFMDTPYEIMTFQSPGKNQYGYRFYRGNPS